MASSYSSFKSLAMDLGGLGKWLEGFLLFRAITLLARPLVPFLMAFIIDERLYSIVKLPLME